MSSIIKKGFLIIITISAGVATLGKNYILYWKKEKEKSITAFQDEKEREKSTNKDNSNTKISKEKNKNIAKSQLEITTSVSLELKKSDLVICKQIEITICKKVQRTEQKFFNKIPSTGKIVNTCKGSNDNSDNLFFYIFSKFTDDDDNKIKRTPKQISYSKMNQNNTILNIIDEFKYYDLSSKINLMKLQNFSQINNQNSLCLPNDINDLEEELNIKLEDIAFDGCELSLEEIKKFKNTFDNLNDTVILQDLSIRNSQRKQSSIDKKKIESVEELDFVISKINRNSYLNGVNYSIQTITKINRMNDYVEIIKDEMFLSILNHLFSKLNEELIELNDNFKDERRKYYNVDPQTYLDTINLFIHKKEKLIYYKLLEITTIFDISQTLLIDTIKFYLRDADESEEITIKIKIAYRRLLDAGVKRYFNISPFSSIAPKNLTKQKLKKILLSQLYKYQEYQSTYTFSVLNLFNQI